MIKRLLVTVYIFFVILTSYSQENPSYNMELITSFSVGNNVGELMTAIKSPSDTGPSAFAFDKEGNLYITDILRAKVVEFNSKWSFVKELKNGYSTFARQLFINDTGEFMIKNHSTFAMDDAEGNKKFIISLEKSEYKKQVPYITDFVYIDNIVYFRLKNGNLINIISPSTDNNKNLEKATPIQTSRKAPDKGTNFSMLYQDIAKSIFKVDSKEVIVKDDKALTTDYAAFYKYWKNKKELEKNDKTRNGSQLLEGKGKKFNFEINEQSAEYMTYIGEDNNDNYYWDIGMMCISIFDSTGNLIEYFNYDRTIPKTLPTVHPDGDIYFLDYDEKEVRLYKVPCVW